MMPRPTDNDTHCDSRNCDLKSADPKGNFGTYCYTHDRPFKPSNGHQHLHNIPIEYEHENITGDVGIEQERFVTALKRTFVTKLLCQCGDIKVLSVLEGERSE